MQQNTLRPPRKVADQWLRDVLRILHQRRTSTRAEVIENTNLNPASVSHAFGQLLESGTILKVGDLQSSGGRRPEAFSLNGEAAYFVGVDLEGHSIRFALANLGGDIRHRWEESLAPGEFLDVRRIFDGVTKVLRPLDRLQQSRVLAIGMSYPGMLDEEGRLTAFNLGWRRMPLVTRLEELAKTHLTFPLPIFLEADRHSCVHVELWMGAARGHKNGVCLMSERGIGIGMFLDGRPVEGWRDMAGELGHWAIDPKSRDRCACGRTGCLEAIASSDNIVRQYLERSRLGGRRRDLKITDVYDRARGGDRAAQAVLERAGRAWGLAISYLVDLLNPEIVILGGDLSRGEDVLLPVIQEEIARRTLPDLLSGVRVIASTLGMDVRLKGACSLAFRRSLTDGGLLRRMCRPVLSSVQAVLSSAQAGVSSAKAGVPGARGVRGRPTGAGMGRSVRSSGRT